MEDAAGTGLNISPGQRPGKTPRLRLRFPNQMTPAREMRGQAAGAYLVRDRQGRLPAYVIGQPPLDMCHLF